MGNKCQICQRPMNQWLLKITVEDTSGFAETAHVCGNCGVKLRLASERTRSLQIDPWIHDAVSRVLRGRD